MDHLLSPAINRVHVTAGTKAGCLPGPDTSLLLMEAGMRLSLILEMPKSQMFPKSGRISLCWSCFIPVSFIPSVKMLLGSSTTSPVCPMCVSTAK